MCQKVVNLMFEEWSFFSLKFIFSHISLKLSVVEVEKVLSGIGEVPLSHKLL